MSDHNYRIVLKGLKKNTDIPDLIKYLNTELNIQEQDIRLILTASPRVIFSDCDIEFCEKVKKKLNEKGCQVIIDEIHSDKSCPLSLTKKNYQLISRELERSLINNFRFALYVITLHSGSEKPLPGLIDEKPLCELLTDEDKVVSIDNSSFIILSYFFGSTNTDHVTTKINDALSSMLNKDANYSIGCSIYPDEACDVNTLLSSAVKSLKEFEPVEVDEDTLSLNILSDSNSPVDTYQQYLISATGKRFKWLSERDFEELWLGLGTLPAARQKEFLYRLPVDAPIIPELIEAINSKRKPDSDAKAIRHISEIIIRIRGFGNSKIDSVIKKEVAEKIKDVNSFPTLPEVAGKLSTIINNPDSSLKDVSSVIKNDPSLTLKLLKVVNSAFYSFQRKITSIEDAVILVGREEIINIAFGFAASEAVFTESVQGLYKPRSLWHHLIGTALISRFLNKKFGNRTDYDLFTAGIIHDFGKIFFIEHYPELYGQLHIEAAEYKIPLYELEEECFGMNHASVGKAIAVKWNLPDPLIEATAFHHQPFFGYEHSSIAAIMGFADYLYHMARPSEDIRQVVTPHSPCLTYGHCELLKDVYTDIRFEDLEKIVEETGEFLEENQSIFSIIS